MPQSPRPILPAAATSASTISSTNAAPATSTSTKHDTNPLDPASGAVAPDLSPGAAAAQQARARGRRTVTLVACFECQKKKTKCDGARPSCSRCRAKGCKCMWETDSREQTRQQATYNKLEEAVLKLEETNARIAGFERLMHELRTLPEDEAVRLFWRIRTTPAAGGTSSSDPVDSESFDWLVGGAGGMSIDEDEYGGPAGGGGGMTHQQQLAGELPPPPFGSAMGLDVGMGEQGQQHHHHHHHQQPQYGEGAYEEGQMYGERHRHH